MYVCVCIYVYIYIYIYIYNFLYENIAECSLLASKKYSWLVNFSQSTHHWQVWKNIHFGPCSYIILSVEH